MIRRDQNRPGLFSVAILLMISALGVIRLSHASATPSLLAQDKQITLQAVQSYKYQNGQWMPTKYLTNTWEKYQCAAAGDAALGVLPDGTAAEREVAIDTVNSAITTHQLPSGDFDDGSAGGSSNVNGTFWAECEGFIALTLKNSVPATTLSKWERSMVGYAQYSKSSGNSTWYSNGNVVLRQDLIMLQAYRLAQLVGDPKASSYLQDYETEKQFLVNPVSPTDKRPFPAWKTYGQYTNANGALWFSESVFSNPGTPISCANNMTPCNGFDPNYATAQLHDDIMAYLVGIDGPFWQNVIQKEFLSLQSLVSNGSLNALNGSRKNITSEVFYPPVYAILENHGLGSDDKHWQEQLNALQLQLAYYEKQPDPGENAYDLVQAIAMPLVDSPTTVPIVGDLNNDHVVNIYDLSILLSNWQKTRGSGGTNPTGDVNADGVVNIYDLSILLSHYT